MRRELSTTSLPGSSSSSPTASSSGGYAKKLNLLAFGGTLVYIGYLFGSVDHNDDGGSQLIQSALAMGGLGVVPDDAVNNSEDTPTGMNMKKGQLRASSYSVDASASWDRIAEGKKNDKQVEEVQEKKESNKATSSIDVKQEVVKTKDSPVVYAKGPVINEHKGPVTSINLIGERHSGTNWITDHLKDCFGDQLPIEDDFTRYKHWFQFDDPTVRNDSALVIAMFRDPYDWIEAMRESPHHAHGHVGMGWFDFVTKPWVGPRGRADHKKMEQAKKEGFHIEKWDCLAGYKFDEVIPCSMEDSVEVDGYSNYMYELKHDESHRAYSSIVELRTAKILNFLQVPKSHGVKAFFPERYEALSLRGTADFLKQLEEVTGLKAKCEPVPGTGVVKHKEVDPEYTKWMNIYHDWNAEAMIGYVKRDPVPGKEMPLPQQPKEEEQPKLAMPSQEQPNKVAQVHN